MASQQLRLQAQFLQVGDQVGSGAFVTYVGYSKLPGKVRVDTASDRGERTNHWGKYTEIGITRFED